MEDCVKLDQIDRPSKRRAAPFSGYTVSLSTVFLLPLFILLPVHRIAHDVQQLPIKALSTLPQGSFVDKAQLFHHTTTALIIGKTVGAHQLQSHLFKGIAQDLLHCLGHQALSPIWSCQQITEYTAVLGTAMAANIFPQGNQSNISAGILLADRPAVFLFHQLLQLFSALFPTLMRRPSSMDSNFRVAAIGVVILQIFFFKRPKAKTFCL